MDGTGESKAAKRARGMVWLEALIVNMGRVKPKEG